MTESDLKSKSDRSDEATIEKITIYNVEEERGDYEKN